MRFWSLAKRDDNLNQEWGRSRSGRQVRKFALVEHKGRFEPVKQDLRLNEHTIGLTQELSQIYIDDNSGAGQALKSAE